MVENESIYCIYTGPLGFEHSRKSKLCLQASVLSVQYAGLHGHNCGLLRHSPLQSSRWNEGKQYL